VGGEYFIILLHLYVRELYNISLKEILLIHVTSGCSNYKGRIDFILICRRVLHVSLQRTIIRYYKLLYNNA